MKDLDQALLDQADNATRYNSPTQAPSQPSATSDHKAQLFKAQKRQR